MFLFVFSVVLLKLFEGNAQLMTESPWKGLEGFWCYSCTDINGNDTWCKGANSLQERRQTVERMSIDQRLTFKGMDGIQDCGVWYPYCAILEIHDVDDNARSQYRRVCSDGKDFSFQYTDASFFTVNVTGTRLSTFLPTETSLPVNRSICQYVEESHAQLCLLVCSGDFCNGPLRLEELEDTSGSRGMMGGPGRGGCAFLLLWWLWVAVVSLVMVQGM